MEITYILIQVIVAALWLAFKGINIKDDVLF
jgi:hypothetical protein